MRASVLAVVGAVLMGCGGTSGGALRDEATSLPAPDAGGAADGGGDERGDVGQAVDDAGALDAGAEAGELADAMPDAGEDGAAPDAPASAPADAGAEAAPVVDAGAPDAPPPPPPALLVDGGAWPGITCVTAYGTGTAPAYSLTGTFGSGTDVMGYSISWGGVLTNLLYRCSGATGSELYCTGIHTQAGPVAVCSPGDMCVLRVHDPSGGSAIGTCQ